MILQALTAYYEQLLKQGKVEAPGWDSRFKVSYELRASWPMDYHNNHGQYQ